MNAVCCQPGLHRGRMHILHRATVLTRQSDAVVKLGRRVQNLAVPPRDLESYWPESRRHGLRLAIQAFTGHLAVTDTDGRGLTEDGRRQSIT